MQVREQTAPLSEQFREIINETKLISKIFIEFLQAISRPKMELELELKQELHKNVNPELKQQLNSIRDGEKLYPMLEALRRKIDQLNTIMVKAMKELTSG